LLGRPKLQIGGVGHLERLGRAVTDKEEAIKAAVVTKPPDIVIQFCL
jgi:hypothetical protein